MKDTSPQSDIAFKARYIQLLKTAKPVLPVCIGVAFANTCFNITLNDTALHFADIWIQNGPLFAAVAFMALAMIALARRKEALSTTQTRIGVIGCIVLQVGAAAGLGLLEFAQSDVSIARASLTSLMYVAALGSLAFWLRCERNASAATAVTVVFVAVLISQPLVCLAAFMPHSIAYTMLAVIGLAQALCLHGATKQSTSKISLSPETSTQPSDCARTPADAETAQGATGYFSLAKTMADDKHLLITTALGIWILSLAKAVIRVFPSGQPIPYTPTTLAVYFALSMIITVVLLHFALGKRSRTMTVGIWIVMQNLAALALIACGFFPNQLDIGLSFVYVLDALLLAYTWYIALAFMSYGRQDPYYYVAGGLIAYLLPRTLTNVAVPLLFGGIGHAAAATALAAALLLLCAQFLFLQFPHAPAKVQRPQKQGRSLSNAAVRAFGIETPADTSTAMRVAIMQSHAVRIQKQFLLSDREAEVLALYALGHTQDKIAEELFLSPGTVHTYVKRLYAKTDLHSRQALLDYIEHYAE